MTGENERELLSPTMDEKQEPSRFPDGFRILQGNQEYVTYQDRSSIRIWPSNVAGNFERHVHSAVEIILPHRGVSVVELPDKVYHVGADEVLIIPAGCPHMLMESAEILRYLLLFEPVMFLNLRDLAGLSDTLLSHPIYLHGGTQLQKQVSDLLMRVISCYFQRDAMWNTQCYSYLLQMYVLLGQQHLDSMPAPRPSEENVIEPEIMNSAMTFIQQHCMENITLEDVASFAGFSKYYFSRMFKRFSGTTFLDYLTRRRLSIAQDLLIRTTDPVRDIARSSGFGSTASFNRIFREYKKCTPTQYRAIYGSNPQGAEAAAQTN